MSGADRDDVGYHLGRRRPGGRWLAGRRGDLFRRYLKARQLRSFLPNFLLPYTRVDDQKNIVSLTGSRPMIRQALAQLQQVDKPGDNLLVEMTGSGIYFPPGGGIGSGSGARPSRLATRLYSWPREISVSLIWVRPRKISALACRL